MNKYIIANLKMYQMPDMISNYLVSLKEFNSEKLILCPSSIYIPYYLEKGYHVGIQNIYFKDVGPYTGEISPLQAKQLGISYVIIGHNERKLFGETDHHINQKVTAALENDLNIILCIGETLDERSNKETILKRQIHSALKNIPQEKIKNILFAYEPIWAIGTGIIPDIEEIETMIHYIQTVCHEFSSDPIKIIYGGSVDEKNISTLVQMKNIAGFLIGSAAVNPDKLIKIIEVTREK